MLKLVATSLWGTITAAIKGKGMNIDHCATLEANSPEPSVPPEPLYDPEIKPYPEEFTVKCVTLRLTQALRSSLTQIEIPVRSNPSVRNSHTANRQHCLSLPKMTAQ